MERRSIALNRPELRRTAAALLRVVAETLSAGCRPFVDTTSLNCAQRLRTAPYRRRPETSRSSSRKPPPDDQDSPVKANGAEDLITSMPQWTTVRTPSVHRSNPRTG